MTIKLNDTEYNVELIGDDLVLQSQSHDLIFTCARQVMTRDAESYFRDNFTATRNHSKETVDDMREANSEEWVSSDYHRSEFILSELQHFKRIDHE